MGCSSAVAAMVGSQITGFGFTSFLDAPQDIFVLVFLRGGCDGLNLVAPVSDSFYVDARDASLRVTESGDNRGLDLKNTLNNLDFKLHKSATALKELYDSNALAIIHACGLPNGTRSHFEAMELIERGMLNDKSGAVEGWLARYLNTAQLAGRLPAVAVSDDLPLSLQGSPFANAIHYTQDFNLHGDPRFPGILKNLYKGTGLLHETAAHTLESIRQIQYKIPRKNGEVLDYQPEATADYPDNVELSDNLKTLAQLIKMDVGLQIATVDFGGWDTHEYQSWHFPTLVSQLSQSIGAFYNDLNKYHNRLTVLVMSEFGRRLKSNKSNGTDHGYGNVMLALGGNVKGGQMYGKWNGLANEQLDNHVDLAVTTDYRTVLSEILVRRFQNEKLGYIFPNLKSYQPLGFLRGADRTIDYNAK